MKIVVTGARGMLGTHLVDRLAADGHCVTGLDVADGAARTEVRDVVGDVRDADLMRRLARDADSVVHAAAALPSSGAAHIADVDVRGTRAVLDAALEQGVERVVHISSTAVYGLPETVPTSEDVPMAPVDPYSAAKTRAEHACREAREAGMCVPVLRPKTFLGPHRMGLFAMLFQWADEGRDFPLLDGGRIRCQMLDVEDLATATATALTGPRAVVDTDINVAAEDFGTLRDDFQAVLDDAGYGRRVRSVPSWPTTTVLHGLAAGGVSPVYHRLLGKLARDSYVTTARAREVLGMVPRHSNASTIRRTYRWWRENQKEISARPAGRTHRAPWRQGALRLAKMAF